MDAGLPRGGSSGERGKGSLSALPHITYSAYSGFALFLIYFHDKNYVNVMFPSIIVEQRKSVADLYPDTQDLFLRERKIIKNHWVHWFKLVMK